MSEDALKAENNRLLAELGAANATRREIYNAVSVALGLRWRAPQVTNKDCVDRVRELVKRFFEMRAELAKLKAKT